MTHKSRVLTVCLNIGHISFYPRSSLDLSALLFIQFRMYESHVALKTVIKDSRLVRRWCSSAFDVISFNNCMKKLSDEASLVFRQLFWRMETMYSRSCFFCWTKMYRQWLFSSNSVFPERFENEWYYSRVYWITSEWFQHKCRVRGETLY